MSQSVFLCLFLVMIAINGNESVWNKPRFCHKLECPPFSIRLDQALPGIELRTYQSPLMVSSIKTGYRTYSAAVDAAFHDLFQYINGKNSKEEKIDMTAPVLTKVTKDAFVVSFFLPYRFQQNSIIVPSALDGSGIALSRLDSKTFAVEVFSGYASYVVNQIAYEKLIRKLDAAKVNHVKDEYFVAVYDSPMRFFQRHNEIWVEVLDSMLNDSESSLK